MRRGSTQHRFPGLTAHLGVPGRAPATIRAAVMCPPLATALATAPPAAADAPVTTLSTFERATTLDWSGDVIFERGPSDAAPKFCALLSV